MRIGGWKRGSRCCDMMRECLANGVLCMYMCSNVGEGTLKLTTVVFERLFVGTNDDSMFFCARLLVRFVICKCVPQ